MVWWLGGGGSLEGLPRCGGVKVVSEWDGKQWIGGDTTVSVLVCFTSWREGPDNLRIKKCLINLLVGLSSLRVTVSGGT